MSQLSSFARVAPRSALIAAAALGLASGCLIINKQHCAYPGSETPCSEGFVCSACAAENNGCVDAAMMEALDPQCLAIEGSSSTTATSTTSPTTGTTTETTTTSTTDATTETTAPVVTETTGTSSTTDVSTSTTDMTGSTTVEPLCDPNQQILDPDCSDPTQPYCVAVGTCGDCTDLSQSGKTCADADPNKPVCDEAGTKLCVQCTKDDKSACPADAPSCDILTGTCVPCFEHDDCESGACDVEMNTCFPTNSEVFVENNTQICVGGNGSSNKPFCTLADAQDSLVPGQPKIVRVRHGTSTMEPLSLAEPGYVVAVVREGNTTPVLDGSMSPAPMITVSAMSRVYLHRFQIKVSGGLAQVQCSNGVLYLDEMDIQGDGGAKKNANGVRSAACKTVARRSKFRTNVGGLLIDKGELWMENSYVVDNGTAAAAFGAFRFIGDPKVTITYSTIADHRQTMSSSNFNCSGGNTNLVIRNSAIVGMNPTVTGCTFPLDMMMVPMLPGTKYHAAATLAEMDAILGQWFFAPLDEVYQPKSGGPLSDLASWQDPDPICDYAKVVRSIEPNSSYAGAAEFPL